MSDEVMMMRLCRSDRTQAALDKMVVRVRAWLAATPASDYAHVLDGLDLGGEDGWVPLDPGDGGEPVWVDDAVVWACVRHHIAAGKET